MMLKYYYRKFRLCILWLFVALITACQPTQVTDTVSQVNTVIAMDTVPSVEAIATPTFSKPALVNAEQGGTMNILYIEYAYYQLEGIPPYPSHYVTLDSVDRQWVDINDPNRFRHERTFHTQTEPIVEGIERTVVGSGLNGTIETCQHYDGNIECNEQASLNVPNLEAWMDNFTEMGRKWLNATNSPDTIGGYIYQGTQNDADWGEVHVFERNGTLQSSDLYYNETMIETIKFDVEQLRRVEWTRTIPREGEIIIHTSYRLVTWELIDQAETPNESPFADSQ